MIGNAPRFLVNFISAFIPYRSQRRRVRAILNAGFTECTDIITDDMGYKPKHIKRIVGARGRNLIISADNKYVYKFPTKPRDWETIVSREIKITDEFRKISPIKIPQMQLLHRNNMLIRRYEYINGTGLSQLSETEIYKHIDKLAIQVAHFVYDIAKLTPKSLKKLQGTTKKPAFMFGWFHNDLYDNLIIDKETFEIIAIIDWEDARYTDFMPYFDAPRKQTVADFMSAVKREYIKIWNSEH